MSLPNDWNIPQEIRSRIGERLGRQRALDADGHLVLVLHKVPRDRNPARQSVAFWRDPAGIWKSSAGGEGIAIIIQHIVEYEQRVDQLEAEYEKADSSERWFTILRQVVPVHRATVHMHAALQAARESIGDDRDVITLRDRAGDIERAIDLLHTDVKNALDYAVARQAERQAEMSHHLSRAGHRLTLLAAIFMPLTAVGGIFGMNLHHGLESAHPVLFWIIVLMVVTMGVMIGLLATRSNGIAAPPGRGGGRRRQTPDKYRRR